MPYICMLDYLQWFKLVDNLYLLQASSMVLLVTGHINYVLVSIYLRYNRIRDFMNCGLLGNLHETIKFTINGDITHLILICFGLLGHN